MQVILQCKPTSLSSLALALSHAGALEKQKLVYVMNRDAGGRLTISSPLEAHKSHVIVYSIVGLDVGTENPIFATIERDYSDADQVQLQGYVH